LKKGLPDSLRSECWRKITNCQQLLLANPGKYRELIKEKSKWSELIDLDINRSFRNHIQFRERYGTGQISLFNILKAYSNYDKEIGYCQGMSNLTAFLLMFIPEEEVFWMLVKILNDAKYDLHGRFIPEFPRLQRSFWIFEQLLLKHAPKVAAHFAKENITTMFYGFKWFMLVFLDCFPFNVTVRVWDLFLLKGYDITYTIALGFIKIHEKRIILGSFDQTITFLRSFENEVIDADQFIVDVRKYKVNSKELRKLEHQYDQIKAKKVVIG